MVPRQFYTPFGKAVERLMPGASAAQQARLFAGRATRFQVHDWRVGRSLPPQWALNTLADIFAEYQQMLKTAPQSVGLGGCPMIHLWNKKRAAEKAALNAKREAGND